MVSVMLYPCILCVAVRRMNNNDIQLYTIIFSSIFMKHNFEHTP